jgi:hypothetical protein
LIYAILGRRSDSLSRGYTCPCKEGRSECHFWKLADYIILELAICKTSTKELHVVLIYEKLEAIRKRFYFKSFSDLRIIFEKKGWLVNKGKSTISRVKYFKTINA